MKNNTTIQLELGMRNQLRNRPLNSYRNVRQDRLKRARWWFSKMREAVDLALPPQPITHARPEQTYLTLSQATFLPE